MKPCAACGCHHREAEACPHCGSSPVGRTAAAALLGLGLIGLPACVSMYGLEVTDKHRGDTADTAVVDLDRDGWGADEDCAPDDPSIHPEAEETPGDGVDSDCDGADDT